jgi:hypothetical protein
MVDYVLTVPSEKEAIAGFAAFGLTQTDDKGNRTIRNGGLTSRVDMEILAAAVEATQELVARETAKGAERDAALVERVKITPQMSVKPEVRDEDYRRELTEWVTDTQHGRMVPTGNMVKDPFGNEVPEMVNDGKFYLRLRWNGDALLPPMPPGFEIIWSSGSLDKNGDPLPYPEGLPTFS